MYDIWKMDALNELQAHEARKRAVPNIKSRIAELESAIVAIRSATADGEPVSGGGSGREAALLNNIVARQYLERSLGQTQNSIDRVENALQALSGDDFRILECFYIVPRKGAASQLASELHIDEKTVYNRRTNALKLFQIALTGEV